jgi:hypothetical protein
VNLTTARDISKTAWSHKRNAKTAICPNLLETFAEILEREVNRAQGRSSLPLGGGHDYTSPDIPNVGETPTLTRELQDIEDTVMAHRFLYYVAANPMLSDYQYDLLEEQARRVLPASSPVHRLGSSIADDYPPRVKALAQSKVGTSGQVPTNCNTPERLLDIEQKF